MTAHGTGIEWTHIPGYKGETWNPVRGCTKVSPGCKNCYAETFAERWRGIPNHPYEQGFDLRLVPEKLSEPLHATKPRAYFVNSMSDLFQADIPFGFLQNVYKTMRETPRHIYMVLTKRADDMRLIAKSVAAIEREGPLPNVWLGVSVEDRKYGLPRIDILRTIPAAVRFLSIEPLLEDLGPLDLAGIHWVIIGGESGPGARPFDVAWADSIVAQCKAQNVPVFLKQLGARPVFNTHGPGAGGLLTLRSRKGSDEREWPERLRGLKQFPEGSAPQGLAL